MPFWRLLLLLLLHHRLLGHHRLLLEHYLLRHHLLLLHRHLLRHHLLCLLLKHLQFLRRHILDYVLDLLLLLWSEIHGWIWRHWLHWLLKRILLLKLLGSSHYRLLHHLSLWIHVLLRLLHHRLRLRSRCIRGRRGSWCSLKLVARVHRWDYWCTRELLLYHGHFGIVDDAWIKLLF